MGFVAPPTDLVATAIYPTRIDLTWTIEVADYTTILIFRKEGAGVVDPDDFYKNIQGFRESWSDIDCVAETQYCYAIKGVVAAFGVSAFSNEDCDTTPAPLEAPTDVVATPISNIEIEITFKDKSENETGHTLQREIDEGDVWRTILELEPNREYFRDGGLFLLAGGYVPCELDDIGKQVSDNGGNIGPLIEYDNARRWWLVDSDHIIANGETMTVVGGSGATGTIARETQGLNVANQYTYRVWVEGLGGPLGPVESNLVTMISVPVAPVLAAIPAADIQDKSIRIRWSDVANETGYRIEQDTVEIAVVGIGVTDFLVTGLDVNTAYTFRVRAYNAAGNSAYSGNQVGTTLLTYVPTAFEKWIRNPNIEPVYLAEIYTKMNLTGFGEEVGVTWKKTISADDRGIDILEVFENGIAYTEGVVIAEELANPNTFYFNYNTRILYVHTTGGDDPADFLIEGAFWLYFSTHKDIEFNDNFYLPFLARENIPDITQEIKAYFEGSFLISSGSIAFINGKIGGSYFFDIKYKTYTWENSRIVLKAGRDDFDYANFETILTSLIDEKSCEDSKITFSLRDIRQEMERDLILSIFTIANYPDIDEDFIGEPIPICFGTKYNVVPIPIDIDRRKYKFHDGRSKSVIAVYKNFSATPTALIEDTDYFVDLQRSIITFERDAFELGEEDIIEISFIGSVNSADEPISNGAEIFKYLMTTSAYYNLLDSDLNLDSIYRTKYEKTDALSIFLYKNKPYREIVKGIEHSTEAFTFQDAEGRLGLRSQLAAAESKAKYIANHQIFNHLQSKSRESLFWKVNVYYNENPQTQEWEVKSAQDDDIPIRYKIWNELDIYSYFSAPSSAQTLATNIKNLLNKETIDNTVPMLLFDVMAGDIIRFSRDRFYSSAGKIDEGSEIDLRIIKISKSPPSGQTTITTEIV